MAASLVLACLIFLFLLPGFISGSCPPALPWNKSIQIMSPFYFHTDNITTKPNCTGSFGIRCHNEHPYLYWSELIPLESISYNNSIMTVLDDNLRRSLKASGCGNLYFNFSTPVRDFYKIYDLLNSSLYSLRCLPPNQIQSPPDIFGKNYNLSYSLPVKEDNKLPQNCLGPNGSDPTFELTFLFKEDSPDLYLRSASYSYNLTAQPGCFTNSKEIFNCTGRCKGSQEKERARNDIIIVGSVVGSAFLVAFFCSLLLLYQRNKLRLASSSSNFLVQRESSDQYFDDLDMAGSGYLTQIFTYKELQEATEAFSTSKELGNGGFGIVYKGKLKDERVVAVKRLHRTNYKRDQQFMNELEILSCLSHPNLVTLYGCCDARTSNELLLVYEFVPNGTVADHLHGRRCREKTLTWPIRLSIAIETANALAYLHAIQPPIIHRDVKTNNILLDDDFHVKVGDFGLSRFLALDATHVSTAPQGTPGYVDPVYHQCYHLTDKSDVYSFGVVLVELISSKPAVDLNRSKDEINLANLALNKIQASLINELVDPVLGFSSNWDVERTVSLVAELAFRCLQYDRETRPSIKEVSEALRGIERGNYGTRDKLLMDHMVTKEETCLLKCDMNCTSSDVMTDSWKTSSVTLTPDTSG